MRTQALLILALLVTTAFADDFDAPFESTVSDWYFHTNMRMTTDFTLSLVSGAVEHGDPANLRSGDTVCSGAVVRVTPSFNSKWAVSSLSIRSVYPTCSGYSYCPAMIDYGGGVSLNKDVRWLDPAVYDDNFNQGDRFGLTDLPARHDQLSTFYTEPVTYTNGTGIDYPNKEGGANVFCKGSFQVADGSTVARTTQLPSTSSADITLATSGSHAISTRISGANCFAAVEKRPLDLPSHSEMFRIYYFTHNAPSMPPTSATKTVTLNVGAAAANCSLHESGVESSGSPVRDDAIMVKVNMCNDGTSPIRVMSVSGSNPGYSVSAFPPPSICRPWFGSLCPDSNGFNQDINGGSCRDVYVLVSRGAGASGDLTLTFNAEGVGVGCGGTSACSDTVLLREGDIYSCSIEPPSLSYGTREVANFLVTCQNLRGATIPCIGNDWFWADGIAGDFWDRTNTHALAYPTSPPGTRGTLRYRSGHAECLSNINVIEPTYVCEFDPGSATLDANESEDFTLDCTVGGTSTSPDDALYDTAGGLCGALSNESTGGVTYTACDENSSGDLRGLGLFGSAPSPVIGAVAIAPIEVHGGGGTGTGNETNETGSGPRGAGSSEWCSIDGFDLPTFFPGYYGWVTLGCGPTGTGPCSGVVWESVEGGVLVGNSTTGTYLHVTTSSGMGRITVHVDGDSRHGCYKEFFVGPARCMEIS